MQILYSPQKSENIILYKFEQDKIEVTLNGVTDIFDFSDFEDGRMLEVETTLEINPILEVVRESGNLKVKLLNFYDEDATEEVLFPTWREV